VAEFSAKHLQFTYPAMAWKIHRVYNGLALPALQPERKETEPPLILSVGRLIEKKGFADLIAACGLLVAKGIQFQCQIVGDGPLEEALQRKIEGCGAGEAVKLVGPKSQTEIEQLLKNTRVFALAAVVLPDGDSDNLPTVITEAMASGVPVVSTRVAGIPEQVEDGQTGFLVDAGDVNALAGRLEVLLGDNALAHRMGDAAFVKAQEEFSLTSTVEKLRQLLPLRPWWKFF
jgi:glycosyltransferase involved in cell wall biosynthesis